MSGFDAAIRVLEDKLCDTHEPMVKTVLKGMLSNLHNQNYTRRTKLTRSVDPFAAGDVSWFASPIPMHNLVALDDNAYEGYTIYNMMAYHDGADPDVYPICRIYFYEDIVKVDFIIMSINVEIETGRNLLRLCQWIDRMN